MMEKKKIKHRILGQYGNHTNGPLLVIVAGIHGNEYAGIAALERVFSRLKNTEISIQGGVIGLAGNLAALNAGVRFMDVDLNRLWTRKKIDYVRDTHPDNLELHEELEQKELLEILEQLTDYRTKEDFLFLDLHTTSAYGGVFSIVNEKPQTTEYARELGVTVIQKLDTVLNSTTLNIFSANDFCALAVEAGQHESAEAIDVMEAAIWVLLEKIGCVKKEAIEAYSAYKKVLKEAAKELPTMVEFSYKHTIQKGDQFEMNTGYKNFQKVQLGEELASDKEGKIVAKHDGLILMPLYQKQGEDGFFMVKQIE